MSSAYSGRALSEPTYWGSLLPGPPPLLDCEWLNRAVLRRHRLGGGRGVRLAALCHATYGTDGFPHALLPLDRRARLRAAI
jgi:hypothetical protein